MSSLLKELEARAAEHELLPLAAAELHRLLAGRFTESEFQELCYSFSADEERFKAGCREYWRCLFGY
jgi:hypothetical protein